jgi:hypothetical protein
MPLMLCSTFLKHADKKKNINTQTFNAIGVFVFAMYRLVCTSQGKDQHVQGKLEGPEQSEREWGAIVEG